jgi:hypothetical protein
VFLRFTSCFGEAVTLSNPTVSAIARGITGWTSPPAQWLGFVNTQAWAARGRRIPDVNITGDAAVEVLFAPRNYDGCGLPYWEVAAVVVQNGGSGYVNGQEIVISVAVEKKTNDHFNHSGRARGIASVDELGGLVSVSINERGEFWLEDGKLPPYTDAITTTIEQYGPSRGVGAQITAVVDHDPFSNTFGQIINLLVTSSGGGYIPTVQLTHPVSVFYKGPNAPPEVLAVYAGCGTTFSTNTLITDCSNFSFVATFGGQTATVAPAQGGQVFSGSQACCERPRICCPEQPAQAIIRLQAGSSSGTAINASDNPGPLTFFGQQFTLSDAFNVSCPSVDIEVVFDILDIIENQCERLLSSRAFNACTGGSGLCNEDEVQTAPQSTASVDLVFTAVGSNEQADFVVTAFPERREAAARLNALGFINCNAQPTLITETRWIGMPNTISGFAGALGSAVQDRTTTMTLLPEQPCSNYPGAWVVTSSAASGALEVGDSYAGFLRVVESPGGRFTIIPVVFRRVCSDYTVEIDFQ